MRYEDLVSNYMPLVRKIAAKYNGYGIPYEDIVQEGLIGLIEASKVFRESENVNFGTYASFWIKKYIITALNKETASSMHAIKISDTFDADMEAPIEYDEQELPSDYFPEDFPEIEKIILIDSFIHKKPLQLIAEKLGISREKARQIRNKAARRIRSLNLNLPKE
ncbi:MAG: sigma-70 family RNA polymerase sigma factor [Candidatus Cloacimonetes bacterium]|nr:sigma-70 family RNA polymerase sigma factor [Candidatus Cloacimonadota bacterium]